MQTKRANRLPEPDSAQGFVAPNGSKFELVKEGDDHHDAYSESQKARPFMYLYHNMTISLE